MFRRRNDALDTFYKEKDGACFCTDVDGLMNQLENEH